MFMKPVWFLIIAAMLVVILGLYACDSWRKDARPREATSAAKAAGEAGTAVSLQPIEKTVLPKTLHTRNGRTYENVEVFRAEPDGLLIVYYGPTSKGIAKLAFADLPDDICRAFNYDSAKAEKFKADRLAGARPPAARPPASPAAAPAIPVRVDAAAPGGVTPATNTMRIELPTAAEVEAYDPELASVIRAVEASKPNIPNLPIEMPAFARQWYDAHCAKVRAEADGKMVETMRRYQELTIEDREPTVPTYITNQKTGVVYPIYPLCIPTNNWKP